MAENKLCPHCGSKMFVAAITRGCVVEVTDDANEPFKLLKESSKGFEIEIAKCARCKHDLTLDDLTTGVPCKECGKIVSPNELNEEGVCEVCVAVKQRSDIANASREDLIKMLLNAEKHSNPVAAKVEKQIQKAEAVEQQTATTPEDTVAEEHVEEETAPATSKKSTTRKKPQNKKKADTSKEDEASTEETVAEETTTVEEPVVEAPVTTEEVQKAADALAGSQEAPFPDVMDVMNPPVETPEPAVETAQSEQAIGAGFEMFPNDDEAF